MDLRESAGSFKAGHGAILGAHMLCWVSPTPMVTSATKRLRQALRQMSVDA